MDEAYFILQGNGSNRNRGCEAIRRSTVRILRQEFGNCRLVCAPAAMGNQEDFHIDEPDIEYVMRRPMRRFSPRWMRLQFYWRVLHSLPPREYSRFVPQARAMLCLGGDNFSLDYGLPLAFFIESRRAIQAGCPVVIWGASIGPFTARPDFEKQAAEDLRKHTLICARENRTVEYLASLGVRDNVRLVADPAFVMTPSEPELTDREASVLKGPCLGLNLSPLLAKFSPPGEPWVSRAARCLTAVAEKARMPIALIPHVDQPPTNSDYEFMQDVLRLAPTVRDRCVLFRRDLGAQQYKWILSRVTAFIGARTHATIAAMSSCTPTASIAYSMKALGINEDIYGHTNWVVSSEELTPESLAETAANLISSAGEVRDHLRKEMPAQEARARDGGRFLRLALENLKR